MSSSIVRFFQSSVPLRIVNFSINAGSHPLAKANFDDTEVDKSEGIERWNDTVFTQDFEDTIVAIH